MRRTQGHSSSDHVSDEAFEPYRLLAVRVLARACMDLTNPSGSGVDRESARVFLAGSGMLLHWCRVAGLDPSRLLASPPGALAGRRLRSEPPSSVTG